MINLDGYKMAGVVETQLGLGKGYFSKALSKGTEIKADLKKCDNGRYIFVKLHYCIQSLIDDGYICSKINPNEADDYDCTIRLARNTLLGFYK